MHGRVCERRHKSRRRHMLISSSRVIATVEGGGSSCLSLSSSTSFSKVNSIRFRFDCPQAVLFRVPFLFWWMGLPQVLKFWDSID